MACLGIKMEHGFGGCNRFTQIVDAAKESLSYQTGGELSNWVGCIWREAHAVSDGRV